jgi:hypothetical protein
MDECVIWNCSSACSVTPSLKGATASALIDFT